MIQDMSFPVVEIQLVSEVPIINGKLTKGDLDTKHSISIVASATESDVHQLARLAVKIAECGRHEISLREIIRAITDSELAELSTYFFKLASNIQTYPATYLLTDALLAYVGDDSSDALLYEDHAFHILEYDTNLHLLLTVIFYKPEWSGDPDVKNVLRHLFWSSQPPSFMVHIDRYGEAYSKRVKKMLLEPPSG